MTGLKRFAIQEELFPLSNKSKLLKRYVLWYFSSVFDNVGTSYFWEKPSIYRLTSHIMWSENSISGSRFLRTVPSNITGCCGTMLSLERSSWSCILQMSTSSINIFPFLGSTTRNRACTKVDFPLPLFPTMPTFFLPGMVHVMFRRTGSSAYPTCTVRELILTKRK